MLRGNDNKTENYTNRSFPSQ
ncbi:hypothetical protein CY0110_16442 [Crocosphaera chwakensis CCY0110]|uniref:Uncharacterized protein n=1 Tax=Crocosphaera chwakensis CCY0110 TaxID=391612 RepID=A3IHX0_9CHRO|nr:hypothetical protein CY0110_16442 [Crocosphaera chwakensis CCY0110]